MELRPSPDCLRRFIKTAAPNGRAFTREKAAIGDLFAHEAVPQEKQAPQAFAIDSRSAARREGRREMERGHNSRRCQRFQRWQGLCRQSSRSTISSLSVLCPRRQGTRTGPWAGEKGENNASHHCGRVDQKDQKASSLAKLAERYLRSGVFHS